MFRRKAPWLFLMAAVALFGAGFAAGQAKNKFAQPKTVLQVSMIKWKAGVSDADKQKAIDGVKDMAGTIPGIKTIWLKADRMQPRDYDTAFAIEFASRDAANNYAESPLHEKWSKAYLEIREASISPQLTNP
ncbi:MAG TPA: Dabb family protein [Candidatus Acidoferrales bacterium]|nr:Dabb family protein [Candidatus Acidoferrales bacterium]